MKKTNIVTATAIASFALTTGCASTPSKITPSFVSPVKYSYYTCGQLGMEMERLQYQANVLGSRQQARRTNDKIMVGVGILVAWPALFFLKGNDKRKAEYAQLTGDFAAAKTAYDYQKCNLSFAPDQEMPLSPVAHTSFDEVTFRQLLRAKSCVAATRMAYNQGSNYHQTQAAEVCPTFSLQNK